MSTNSFSISTIENFRVKVVPETPGTTIELTTTLGTETIEINANGFADFFVPSSQIVSGLINSPTGASQSFSTSFTFTQLGNIQTFSVVIVEFFYSPAQPIRIVSQDNTNYSDTLFKNIKVGKKRQIKDSYCIKRLTGKTEDITITSATPDSIEIKIYDYYTDIQVGSTINMVESPSTIWNANFTWSGINEGYYYIELDFIVDGSSVKVLRSEPIDLRDLHDDCLEITYTNFDNAYGIIFDRVPNLIPYYILISADLIPEDDDGEIDIFLDDENTATLTHDEVLDLYRIQTLCPLPFYYVKTLQIALGMDEVTIGGEKYVKRNQGSREVFGPYGLMYNFSIQIQKKEFNNINYFNRSTLTT